MISAGTVAAIGALMVLLGTSGTKVKSFLGSLQRFWLAKIVLDQQLAGAIFRYCNETTLAMDILSQSTTVFWDGWKPIIASPGKWICFDSCSTSKICF